MTVRQLINRLIEFEPDQHVYVHLPDRDDDFAISDVTEVEPDNLDAFIRLSHVE